ncbi:MAG: hypothetical protein WCK90_01570 [archaeon]
MDLEKTLAEIEVLSEEVFARIDTEKVQQDALTTGKLSNAQRTIRYEPARILDRFNKSQKAISFRNREKASKNITEFCLDMKNLADSLNIFLQSLYGQKEPELKRLETNLIGAPTTSRGSTLQEIYLSVHDFSCNSVGKILRDMGAHGRGYSALAESDSPSGYKILVSNDDGTLYTCDAERWLNKEADLYFGMTKTILETIAEREKDRLSPKGTVKRKSASWQRSKNWMGRYKAPLVAALATGLVVSGGLGMGMLDVAVAKNKQIAEQKEVSRIMTAGFRQILQDEPQRPSNDEFNNLVDKIKERWIMNRPSVERLTQSVDYAIMTRNDMSLPEKVNAYLVRKRDFLEKLDKIEYDEINFPRAVKSLNQLNLLLHQEKYLLNEEREILTPFGPHLFYNDFWTKK